MIYKSFLKWEDIINNISICENCLLLIDIDNTLIKPKTDLGSDHFFEWQINQINNDGDIKLTSNKDKLLQIMYKLWNYVEYELCEKNIELLLKKIKEIYNIDIILLTSRNDICSNSLKDILVDLKIFKLLLNKPNIKINYDNISYKNGIIFCNGKNKGLCLQIILSKMKVNYEKIILIDDKFKNLVDVKNIFINTDCILYTGCNSIVDTFNNSSKEKVLNEYLLFMQNLVLKYKD